MKKIYVSVNTEKLASRWVIEEVRQILERGNIEVITQKGMQLDEGTFGSKLLEYTGFMCNYNNLMEADVLLIVLEVDDVMDEKMIWECGVAYAAKIPIIIVVKDESKIPWIIEKAIRIHVSKVSDLKGYDFEKLMWNIC